MQRMRTGKSANVKTNVGSITEWKEIVQRMRTGKSANVKTNGGSSD